MSEPLSSYTGDASPNFVEINGVKFQLKEFDMRTRALWLEIAKEYKLEEFQNKLQLEVIPKISRISGDISSDPRIKSIEKRVAMLEKKHDKLLELYATDDEPEGLEEQLDEVVTRMDTLGDEMQEMMVKIQDEVIAEAKEAESVVGEFMEVQDKARVDFVWRLANAAGNIDMELEDFFQSCDGSDYEAAEKFVSEGNASWASLYQNRMQKKPKMVN